MLELLLMKIFCTYNKVITPILANIVQSADIVLHIKPVITFSSYSGILLVVLNNTQNHLFGIFV